MSSWISCRRPVNRTFIPVPIPPFIPTFHILIATSGRPCLRRMLDSLKSELTSNDAITIVFDGKGSIDACGFTNDWIKDHRAQCTMIEQDPNLGYWGHGIRNVYQGNLSPTTTFIMNADDDDVYIAGSFQILRSRCTDPSTLYIACLYDSEKKIRIPSLLQRNIVQDDISTQCGIIPFDKAGASEWKNRYGGDFDYYDHLQKHVANTIFLDTIIYTIRP